MPVEDKTEHNLGPSRRTQLIFLIQKHDQLHQPAVVKRNLKFSHPLSQKPHTSTEIGMRILSTSGGDACAITKAQQLRNLSRRSGCEGRRQGLADIHIYMCTIRARDEGSRTPSTMVATSEQMIEARKNWPLLKFDVE
jgi:hypothetical protein